MIIEVKPSSKWNPDWWDVDTDQITSSGLKRKIDEKVFYAAPAQLHYYMAHSGADYAGPTYGALLTDKYLVPVKREGSAYGELQIAAPIPWERHFADGETISDFTVQSALWYLSMLSSMPDWHYNRPTTRITLRKGSRGFEDKPTQRDKQER